MIITPRWKWIIYVALAVYVLGFAVLIALYVVRPMRIRQELLREQERAKQEVLIRQADSIERAARISMQEVILKHEADSMLYQFEKKKISKTYDARLKSIRTQSAAVAQLPDSQFNQAISITGWVRDSFPQLR